MKAAFIRSSTTDRVMNRTKDIIMGIIMNIMPEYRTLTVTIIMTAIIMHLWGTLPG